MFKIWLFSPQNLTILFKIWQFSWKYDQFCLKIDCFVKRAKKSTVPFNPRKYRFLDESSKDNFLIFTFYCCLPKTWFIQKNVKVQKVSKYDYSAWKNTRRLGAIKKVQERKPVYEWKIPEKIGIFGLKQALTWSLQGWKGFNTKTLISYFICGHDTFLSRKCCLTTKWLNKQSMHSGLLLSHFCLLTNFIMLRK